MVMTAPEKGDLVYLNFSPQSGHEQAGHRPAIILSPKSFNQSTKFVMACPITNQEKGYPFEVKLPDDLAVKGVVLTDQISSMDWRSRNLKFKGQAPNELVQECIEKIQTFLYE